jgi:hypothetical protein
MHRGVRAAAVIVAVTAGIAAPALAIANTSTRTPARESRARKPVHRTVVVGMVVDRDGRGIPNASVIAAPVSTDECQPRTVVTDSYGQFELDGLAPGDYWFIGIHGDHPFGMTPALPVRDRLEVAITLDLAVLSA